LLGFCLNAAAAEPAKSARKKPEARLPEACEEQKRRYRESEACFARYRERTEPGKSRLRPEAFRHCKEMKQPDC
jgi:hypothetical protein